LYIFFIIKNEIETLLVDNHKHSPRAISSNPSENLYEVKNLYKKICDSHIP